MVTRGDNKVPKAARARRASQWVCRFKRILQYLVFEDCSLPCISLALSYVYYETGTTVFKLELDTYDYVIIRVNACHMKRQPTYWVKPPLAPCIVHTPLRCKP